MSTRSLRRLACIAAACLLYMAAPLAQQAPLVPPATLLKPLSGDWPSYSGDYTGQRFSRLTQIDRSNVKRMTLAWTARMNSTVRTSGALVTQTGGRGNGDFPVAGASMKGSILEVNGILYVTSPDHAWAIDGRDGRELWHYYWKTRGSTHIASRGAAIWNDSLLFETPDNYLVSLDVHTGKENWRSPLRALFQRPSCNRRRNVNSSASESVPLTPSRRRSFGSRGS